MTNGLHREAVPECKWFLLHCIPTLFPVDEPILSFQRNAFLPLKEERNLLKKQDSNDPKNYRKAINLLYHEVGLMYMAMVQQGNK